MRPVGRREAKVEVIESDDDDDATVAPTGDAKSRRSPSSTGSSSAAAASSAEGGEGEEEDNGLERSAIRSRANSLSVSANASQSFAPPSAPALSAAADSEGDDDVDLSSPITLTRSISVASNASGGSNQSNPGAAPIARPVPAQARQAAQLQKAAPLQKVNESDLARFPEDPEEKEWEIMRVSGHRNECAFQTFAVGIFSLWEAAKAESDPNRQAAMTGELNRAFAYIFTPEFLTHFGLSPEAITRVTDFATFEVEISALQLPSQQVFEKMGRALLGVFADRLADYQADFDLTRTNLYADNNNWQAVHQDLLDLDPFYSARWSALEAIYLGNGEGIDIFAGDEMDFIATGIATIKEVVRLEAETMSARDEFISTVNKQDWIENTGLERLRAWFVDSNNGGYDQYLQNLMALDADEMGPHRGAEVFEFLSGFSQVGFKKAYYDSEQRLRFFNLVEAPRDSNLYIAGFYANNHWDGMVRRDLAQQTQFLHRRETKERAPKVHKPNPHIHLEDLSGSALLTRLNCSRAVRHLHQAGEDKVDQLSAHIERLIEEEQEAAADAGATPLTPSQAEQHKKALIKSAKLQISWLVVGASVLWGGRQDAVDRMKCLRKYFDLVSIDKNGHLVINDPLVRRKLSVLKNQELADFKIIVDELKKLIPFTTACRKAAQKPWLEALAEGIWSFKDFRILQIEAEERSIQHQLQGTRDPNAQAPLQQQLRSLQEKRRRYQHFLGKITLDPQTKQEMAKTPEQEESDRRRFVTLFSGLMKKRLVSRQSLGDFSQIFDAFINADIEIQKKLEKLNVREQAFSMQVERDPQDGSKATLTYKENPTQQNQSGRSITVTISFKDSNSAVISAPEGGEKELYRKAVVEFLKKNFATGAIIKIPNKTPEEVASFKAVISAAGLPADNFHFVDQQDPDPQLLPNIAVNAVPNPNPGNVAVPGGNGVAPGNAPAPIPGGGPGPAPANIPVPAAGAGGGNNAPAGGALPANRAAPVNQPAGGAPPNNPPAPPINTNSGGAGAPASQTWRNRRLPEPGTPPDDLGLDGDGPSGPLSPMVPSGAPTNTTGRFGLWGSAASSAASTVRHAPRAVGNAAGSLIRGAVGGIVGGVSKLTGRS